MLQYYELLRSVLRVKPHLRRCLSRCRHCRIFFITDPRNAGRRDLGCPFGCREAHRKQSSTRRSVEYYRGDCGKIKKKIQNDKGRAKGDAAGEVPEELSESYVSVMLEYLRMVISQIEGRRVSVAEIVEMLSRVLRQHSMARQRRIDHIVSRLHELPP